MKIHKNVLSPDLIVEIENEFSSFQNIQRWSPSSLAWDPYLTDPFLGQCFVTIPSSKLRNKLCEEIKSFFSDNDNLVIQYYRWCKNSGIAWHHDSTYKFGATIYLNKEWNINHGGLFIWEDETGYQVKLPEFNTMIINDLKQGHLVTPVSNNAPVDRLTIQIWST